MGSIPSVLGQPLRRLQLPQMALDCVAVGTGRSDRPAEGEATVLAPQLLEWPETADLAG